MSCQYSAIDLFSGAGGFSLGMTRAGIRVVAAVDCDPQTAATYQCNFPRHPFFGRDLTRFSPSELRAEIGRDTVDIIFGGPPCQGFSAIKMGNHGARIIKDERRELYRPFLDYVAAFRPTAFVMENVPGIRTAVNGEIHADIIRRAEGLGYEVRSEVLRAWRFGIPQKRVRLVIVGLRDDMPPFPDGPFVAPTHNDIGGDDDSLEQTVTLWEAIGDLPRLKAGGRAGKYDLRRREDFIAANGDRYIANVAKVWKSEALTGHCARPHIDRDLRDFARLREGENSASALSRGVEMEFPNERGEKFKDRYTRQHRDRLSSTIIAHLSRDGLMFIHPTQRRSFTPREAARVQSFPDRFDFPAARTRYRESERLSARFSEFRQNML